MLNYFKESVVWLNILTFWYSWSFFVCMLSHFSCVWLFETLWNVACQVPQSMEFSRQECWSGSHSLLQGIFPTQGSNLCLISILHCRQVLYPSTTWEAKKYSSKKWTKATTHNSGRATDNEKILQRFILEAVIRSWCRWTVLLRVKYSEIYCEKILYRKHIPVCSY